MVSKVNSKSLPDPSTILVTKILVDIMLHETKMYNHMRPIHIRDNNSLALMNRSNVSYV